MHALITLLASIVIVFTLFFMSTSSTDQVTDANALAQHTHYTVLLVLGNLLVCLSVLIKLRDN